MILHCLVRGCSSLRMIGERTRDLKPGSFAYETAAQFLVSSVLLAPSNDSPVNWKSQTLGNIWSTCHRYRFPRCSIQYEALCVFFLTPFAHISSSWKHELCALSSAQCKVSWDKCLCFSGHAFIHIETGVLARSQNLSVPMDQLCSQWTDLY